jgi:hypothetical protein
METISNTKIVRQKNSETETETEIEIETTTKKRKFIRETILETETILKQK